MSISLFVYSNFHLDKEKKPWYAWVGRSEYRLMGSRGEGGWLMLYLHRYRAGKGSTVSYQCVCVCVCVCVYGKD
jgi:hypothetical protein